MPVTELHPDIPAFSRRRPRSMRRCVQVGLNRVGPALS
jgi:hypothetical protein